MITAMYIAITLFFSIASLWLVLHIIGSMAVIGWLLDD